MAPICLSGVHQLGLGAGYAAGGAGVSWQGGEWLEVTVGDEGGGHGGRRSLGGPGRVAGGVPRVPDPQGHTVCVHAARFAKDDDLNIIAISLAGTT